MNREIGNNGAKLVEVLHFLDLIQNGQTVEQLQVLATPYMVNVNHFNSDDFWEDVYCRAEELSYKIVY